VRLTSADFAPGGALDTRHGKQFENLSPALAWTEVPPGAASLVLTLVDTHPVARGYVHWFVDGIPPVDGEFMRRKPYAGPFPPSGTHDYVFSLCALDASALDLPAQASVDDFLEAADGHVLDTATLTGRFTKPT
jgi:phosphatidylethanolamine-binding protein (PEBP) family uncharacterized protein